MRLRLFHLALTTFGILAAHTSYAQEIAIGVVTPMSGPVAVFGRGVYDGARLATEEINAQGGVSGKKLRLVAYDDQGQSALAVQQTLKLIQQDKVSALIGYPSTRSVLEASRVATESDVLLIAVDAFSNTRSTRSGPILHMLDRSGRLSLTVADYVKNNFHDKRVGLWLPGAGELADSIRRSIETSGATNSSLAVSLDPTVPPWLSSVDIAIAAPGFVSSVVPMLESNSALNAIVPAPVLTDQLAGLVQGSARIVALTNPSPQFFPDAAPALARANEAHVSASGYFLYAFAAVQVFSEAAKRAQSFGGGALFNAATESPIKTVLGNRRFDEQGNIQNLYIVITRKSGEAIASVDVCKRSDCKNWGQCPPDCPR